MEATLVMSSMVAWLQLYVPYTFLLPLIGAFFGGEETILVIAMFSATGVLSLQEVVLFSFIGTMLSDVCWFQLGKYMIHRLERKPRVREKFEMISTFIQNVARGKTFIALLITKFLYGTRIIMIFYMGKVQLSFRTFLLYNSAVTAIWSVAVCGLGYFAGRGIIYLLDVYHNLSYSLSIIALIIVIIYALRIWLNRRLVEGKQQLL